MIAILLAAAGVRLIGLPAAPPGLNQDEAANAWNAWCLLRTGHDQAGASWPVFWTHALGENRSTLYLYALIPFQAIGGLNVWTTRLPAAVTGVLCVALIAWIARRLFDRTTAAVAAGLAAFAPWYVDLSRWGHEASLGPLLGALSFAALLWAGLVASADDESRGLTTAGSPPSNAPCWWRAAIAGLLSGIACYGYPAVRIYLPVLVVCTLAVSMITAWSRFRSRRGAAAVLAFCAALALTFGPLAYQHIISPETIARRAGAVWLWEPGDAALVVIGKVAARYAAHFGPSTLVFAGLDDQQRGPLGFGAFSWYILPMLITGAALMLPKLRRSPSARIIVLGALLYPAGDCLHRYSFEGASGIVDLGPHILRSGPGLWALTVLAAAGAVGLTRRMVQVRAGAAKPLLAVALVVGVASDIVFLAFFFGSYRHRPAVVRDYHADLVEALRWAAPRIRTADAVFITASGMNMPYPITLVMADYDPREWFTAARDVRTFSESEFEYYFRIGHFYFVYDDSSRAALRELRANNRPDRVLMIMRPEETGMRDPVYQVRDSEGRATLAVFEVTL